MKLTVALLALLLCCPHLHADSINDAEAKKSGASVQVTELENLKRVNASLLTKNAELTAQVDLLRKQLDQAHAQTKELGEKLANLQPKALPAPNLAAPAELTMGMTFDEICALTKVPPILEGATGRSKTYVWVLELQCSPTDPSLGTGAFRVTATLWDGKLASYSKEPQP